MKKLDEILAKWAEMELEAADEAPPKLASQKRLSLLRLFGVQENKQAALASALRFHERMHEKELERYKKAARK